MWQKLDTGPLDHARILRRFHATSRESRELKIKGQNRRKETKKSLWNKPYLQKVSRVRVRVKAEDFSAGLSCSGMEGEGLLGGTMVCQ
jgi:hypothetical protein